MLKQIKSTILNGIFAFIFITIVWYILFLTVNSKAVANPITVFYQFPHLITRDKFYLHVVSSLFRILKGIFLAIIIGGLTGAILGMFPKIDKLLNPIIYVLYPIPKLAFLPIIILLFGLKDLSKVILIVSILVFQIITSVRATIQNIPKENFTYFKILGIGKLQIFYHLILKYIIKDIFTSIKIAIGTAISVLFFTENYGTIYGIGYYIMDSFQKADYVNMYSGIIVISFIGYMLFSIIDILEKWLTPWEI